MDSRVHTGVNQAVAAPQPQPEVGHQGGPAVVPTNPAAPATGGVALLHDVPVNPSAAPAPARSPAPAAALPAPSPPAAAGPAPLPAQPAPAGPPSRDAARLEKFYDQIMKNPQHGVGVGMLSNIGDLVSASNHPDPEMRQTVARIVGRISGRAYNDWYHADAKQKEKVAQQVDAHLTGASYDELHPDVAHEVMDKLTTLRTSFHSQGSRGYQAAQDWGTGILTGIAQRHTAGQ